MDPDQFFNELILEFPTLKEKIDDWDSESTHPKMEVFAVYTKDQILMNDLSEIKKCFQFQERRIELADDNLINCITVSYCESILLGRPGTRIEKVTTLMGPRLLKLYTDYEKQIMNLARDLSKIRTAYNTSVASCRRRSNES